MKWELLIPIIATHGLAVAERIWQLWNTKGEPTQADWDQLKALSAQTSRSRLLDALSRAGISVDDPKAVELLKMVSPQ